MKNKNQVIKTLELIKKYSDKKNPAEMDLMLLVNDVYNSLIDDYRKKFLKSTIKLTIEECDNLSDWIIDLSDILISSVIRTYSLDTTSTPYELPQDKISKLKKHFSKFLIYKKDDVITTEISSCLFTVSYFTPIKKAIENRKLALSKKKK